MGKTLSVLPLLFILTVAAFLRLHRLKDNPAGFFCDEASIGYNAYSILTTGKDEWGKKFPLFFKAFGEYKNPVMTYSSVPFVLFFGLNEFSVRLVSVFYGLLSILAIYLLATIFFNHQIGLISSFFLAISPWHIHFSRVSLEGLTPFVFFTTLATYFWFKFLRYPNRLLCPSLSIFIFSLALYSYFPARIFLPLYCFSLALLSLKRLFSSPRRLFFLFLLTLSLIIPLLHHLINGGGLSRWYQVRGESNIKNLVQKYPRYFSPVFLFSQGDIGFPGQFISRHSVKNIGQLYYFQLPLLLISLVFIRKTPILFFWLIAYPLCDLFTDSVSPQATRTIIGVIPFQILSTAGLYHLAKKISLAKLIFPLVIIYSVFAYLPKLFSYPLYSSDFWGWQYGPRPIMAYFLEHHSQYDQLCLEGKFNAPEIFLKFYDPKNICQNKCQVCDQTVLDDSKRQLFAVSQETYDKLIQSSSSFKTHQTIYYPNEKTAFIIGEFN